MLDSTARVLDVLEELLEATRSARSALSVNEELIVQSISALRSGGEITDLVHAEPIGDQRQATQEALDRVNTGRHQLRLTVIAACIEAGMTPREIAEQWDISRQRVDQFVQKLKRARTD